MPERPPAASAPASKRLMAAHVGSGSPRPRILHKLYLTACWLLAAFALIVTGVQVVNQVSEYRRDHPSATAWRPKSWRPLSQAEARGLGLEPASSSNWERDTRPVDDWKELGFIPDPRPSGWQRLGEVAVTSGASLIPLLVLVAARRWVLWLLRPEVEPSAGQ